MPIRRLLLCAVFVFLPPAVWPQGNPVGPEFRVNSYTTGFQGFYGLSVAADLGNSFVVVWASQDQDGSGTGVFAQRYSITGVPLGPEFRANTYTTGTQSRPSVAADSAGNFIVVWDSPQDGSTLGIYGQRYASSGTPIGPEFRVNSYTTGFQTLPSVAADPSGNFVVVWSSAQDGSYGSIVGQRYTSSGIPLGGEFRVNTYTTNDQFDPSVSADSLGNFVVVWQSYAQDGSGLGVFAQRYASSGAPLGPEFRVNTFTAGAQYHPAVDADSAGNFVVVWESAIQDGSASGTFALRFASSGVPLGPEFRVNSYTTSTQNNPSVAADSAGNFVVVWRSFAQDGSGYGIFGQRYANSGSPLGPEFRVNTYTTGPQFFSFVTSDASGDFVVVWLSYAQDGSADGVYGQRYNMIVPVELMQFRVE